MIFQVFVLLAAVLETVFGHGMMLDPTNRASLWRYDPLQPINYDDNQYYCGGKNVQYDDNDGNCGVCGDNYADPQPRTNENTGIYGNGIISRNYSEGQTVEVYVWLTANHLGSFHYSLCVLEDPSLPESEECFQPINLIDGSSQYNVSDTDFHINNTVQLPNDVTCERCVLRWHYRAGNSWGPCEDGTEAEGCGPQETFRSCADVSITKEE